MQTPPTLMDLMGSQAQVLVAGLYVVPPEQITLSHVKVREFHDVPVEHPQPFDVAVLVELVTVEQSKHIFVPGIYKYPESRLQSWHPLESTAEEQSVYVLLEEE
jgi:hypothetical protein